MNYAVIQAREHRTQSCTNLTSRILAYAAWLPQTKPSRHHIRTLRDITSERFETSHPNANLHKPPRLRQKPTRTRPDGTLLYKLLLHMLFLDHMQSSAVMRVLVRPVANLAGHPGTLWHLVTLALPSQFLKGAIQVFSTWPSPAEIERAGDLTTCKWHQESLIAGANGQHGLENVKRTLRKASVSCAFFGAMPAPPPQTARRATECLCVNHPVQAGVKQRAAACFYDHLVRQLLRRARSSKLPECFE